MLRTLTDHDKLHWKNSINQVVHAYNCTKHDSTNYSPFFLLFGRHPRLPIDLLLPTKHSEKLSHTKYVQNWKTTMQEAYKIANQKSQKAHLQNKRQYDKKANFFTQLAKGDRVLVHNLTPRGEPGKLRSNWEEEVYVAVDQKGTNTVYTVVPEGHKGKSRVLHRKLLLPCPYLPLNLPPESANLYPPEPATHHSPDSATSDSSHSDNSDDDKSHQTIPQRTPRIRRPPLQLYKSIALRFDLLLFLQIVPFPHSHSLFITLHNLQDNFFPHRISHTLLRLVHTFILYPAHLLYYHDSFFEHLRSSSLICVYTNRIYHCFVYIFHFCPMFTIEARIRTISVTYTCFFFVRL